MNVLLETGSFKRTAGLSRVIPQGSHRQQACPVGRPTYIGTDTVPFQDENASLVSLRLLRTQHHNTLVGYYLRRGRGRDTIEQMLTNKVMGPTNSDSIGCSPLQLGRKTFHPDCCQRRHCHLATCHRLPIRPGGREGGFHWGTR